MSRESRMFAGILSFLTGTLPGYNDNLLRHDLWRAGHAHAGVYLVLSVMLRYVDEAVLSPFWKWLARAECFHTVASHEKVDIANMVRLENDDGARRVRIEPVPEFGCVLGWSEWIEYQSLTVRLNAR